MKLVNRNFQTTDLQPGQSANATVLDVERGLMIEVAAQGVEQITSQYSLDSFAKRRALSEHQ